MKRVSLVVLVAVCGFAAACGKSNTAPTPTVSALALSPATDYVKLKGTEKFSVTATLTTGATEPVTPTWTSDNQAVATVDAGGTLTGVGAGTATITASYQGKAVTRLVRVIPDYAGHWVGTWAVTGCTVQGDFRPDWCAGVQGTFPVTLDLLQAKDVISGTWTLQEANGTVQGSVSTDGTLSLTGSSLQSGVTITIKSWSSKTTDNQAMTGTFSLEWTTAGKNGSAVTQVDIRSFTKR